jgi:hypothetical protein
MEKVKSLLRGNISDGSNDPLNYKIQIFGYIWKA